MAILTDALASRRRLAERYSAAFEDAEAIVTPSEPAQMRHSWQSYQVRLADGVDRDALMQHLLDDGIATRRGVMASHLEPAYAGSQSADLPVTEDLSRTTMMLPLFPDLSDGDQDYIIDRLNVHLSG